MIFKCDRLFYWPDADASSPRRSRGMLASVEGQQKKPIAQKIMLLLLLSLFQYDNESLKDIYSLSTITT